MKRLTLILFFSIWILQLQADPNRCNPDFGYFDNEAEYCLFLNQQLNAQLPPNPSFRFLVGDASGNVLKKTIQWKGDYYTIGIHGVQATISRFTSFGQRVWTNVVNDTSNWADFIITPSDQIIAVGYRDKVISDAKDVLLGICNLNGTFTSLTSSNNAYAESYNSIILNSNPANIAFPYYILGNEQKDSFPGSDDVTLTTINTAGTVLWKKRYNYNVSGQPSDDEYFARLSQFDITGNLACFGHLNTDGVYLVVNNLGAVLGSSKSLNLSAILYGKTDVSASTNFFIPAAGIGTSSGMIIKMSSTPTQQFRYTSTALSQITNIIPINASQYYALGYGMIAGKNRPIVTKFTDNGTSLSFIWTRYVDANETAFTAASISLNASGNIVYTDGRTRASGGFGSSDGFLAVVDFEKDTCMIKSASLSFIKSSVGGTAFAVRDSVRNIPSNINLPHSPLNYSTTEYCKIPCQLNFTFTYNKCGLVNFAASSNLLGPIQYCWDFGDAPPCGSTIANPSHAYTTNGGYTVCLTAKDAFDSCTVCKFIQITNADKVLPNIQCPPNITIDCHENIKNTILTGKPIVTDNIDPNPVVSFVDVVQVEGPCRTEIIRVWSAVDGCSNKINCQQRIVQLDREGPRMECPENLTLDCKNSIDPINTGRPQVEDRCQKDITLSYTDSTRTVDCIKIILRTWTATDLCGNQSTCMQTISLVDNTPPSIECPPSRFLDCNASIDPDDTGKPIVSDGCGKLASLNFVDSKNTNNPCTTFVIRTWTATDLCGNTASCSQSLILIDSHAPIITGCGRKQVAQGQLIDGMCFANVTLPAPNVSDDCNTVTITNSKTNTSNASSLFPDGTTIVTWTATDACGNKAVCRDTVIVLTCADSCDTQTLLINTGLNTNTGILYPVGTQISEWTLVTSPTSSVSVPFLPYVITPNPAWANQANAAWISPYQTAAFQIDNPAPAEPYTFENCFCVDDTGAVTINLSVYVDDAAIINLVDGGGNLFGNLLNIPSVGLTAFSGAPHSASQSFNLPQGQYCIRAEVRNLHGTAMGLNVVGSITGAHLQHSRCCSQDNFVTGHKFIDNNCNGKKDPGENGGANWTIQIKDNIGNLIASQVTDVFGNYTFHNIPLGNYVVSEIQQATHTQSFPATNTYNISITSLDQIINGLDFGNCKKDSTEVPCGYRCCDDEDIEDFEEYALGALPNQQVGWRPITGNPRITNEGCDGTTRCLYLLGATRGYPGTTAEYSSAGVAGPNVLFRKDSTYCISFCGKYIPVDTYTIASITILLDGTQLTSMPLTTTWQHYSYTFTASMDYVGIQFSNTNTGPLDIPPGILIDQVCFGIPKPIYNDLTPPTFECPESSTINVVDIDCASNYTIPFYPANDINGVEEYQCKLDGIAVGIGSNVLLNQGIHVIQYTAIDPCGNIGTCSFEITIVCQSCPCDRGSIAGVNLIDNGDFEDGNTGFSSDYIFRPAPLLLTPGYYGVRNSSNLGNGSWSCTDHTNSIAEGLFLAADGPNPNDAVWAQTISVEEGKYYQFCFWANNLIRPNLNSADPIIEVRLNGATILGPIAISEIPNNWIPFTVGFTANTSSVLLEIYNVQTGGYSDLAVDDISLNSCSPQLVNCCRPDSLFQELVSNAVALVFDANKCKATASISNLPDSCNIVVESIAWGDGVVTDGPFTNGDMPMHTYTSTNMSYLVKVLFIEYDENGEVCNSYLVTKAVTVICDDCCNPKKYKEFKDLIAQGFAVNIEDCTVTVTAPQFNDCFYFGSAPDFGDGTPVSHVITYPSGSWTHTYAGDGEYDICVTVYAYKNNDTNKVCWVKRMCTTVALDCTESCVCNGFSNLSIGYDKNHIVKTKCKDTVDLECPPKGCSWSLSGQLDCTGNCETSKVHWELIDPASSTVVASGSTLAFPSFGIYFPPHIVANGGLYHLKLSGDCGNQARCFCIVSLNFKGCKESCECDFDSFVKDVEAGVNIVSSNNDCIVCFQTKALTACDEITWSVLENNPTPFATTHGQQMVCHNFKQPGTYKVIMEVVRYDENGEPCLDYTKIFTIVVDCGVVLQSLTQNTSCLNAGNENNNPGIANINGLGLIDVTNNIALQANIIDGVTYCTGNLNQSEILSSSQAICLNQGMNEIQIGLVINDQTLIHAGTRLHIYFSATQTMDASMDNLFEISSFEIPQNGLQSYQLKTKFTISRQANFKYCDDGEQLEGYIIIKVSNGMPETLDHPNSIIGIQSICFPVITNQTESRLTEINSDIRVFPNPSMDEFNLEILDSKMDDVTLYVYNNTGTLIETIHSQYKLTRFGSEYSSGIYFIKVVNGDLTRVVKIVKKG